MIDPLASAWRDGACEAAVEGLRAEFGAVLAARILEAEAADFLWQARLSERYLGPEFAHTEEGDSELSRVAIVSFLAGKWHAATCLADGNGCVVALLASRTFARRGEAEAALERAG